MARSKLVFKVSIMSVSVYVQCKRLVVGVVIQYNPAHKSNPWAARFGPMHLHEQSLLSLKFCSVKSTQYLLASQHPFSPLFWKPFSSMSLKRRTSRISKWNGKNTPPYVDIHTAVAIGARLINHTL